MLRLSNRFIALDLALAAADIVLPLLDAVPPRHRKLGEQCHESTTSAPLNLAEGAGRFGRDRRYHYSIALGSAQEAKTSLHLLRTVRAVDAGEADRSIRALDRACAATWRLLHPRRR